MAEAFVKIFRRDYVRIGSIPDAAAALALIDGWMEDGHIDLEQTTLQPLDNPFGPRLSPIS